MNSLIGMGALTSFVAGLASPMAPGVTFDTSFLEEPVMLLAFVLLGRSLEARARLKASGTSPSFTIHGKDGLDHVHVQQQASAFPCILCNCAQYMIFGKHFGVQLLNSALLCQLYEELLQRRPEADMLFPHLVCMSPSNSGGATLAHG